MSLCSSISNFVRTSQQIVFYVQKEVNKTWAPYVCPLMGTPSGSGQTKISRAGEDVKKEESESHRYHALSRGITYLVVVRAYMDTELTPHIELLTKLKPYTHSRPPPVSRDRVWLSVRPDRPTD